MAAPRGPTVSLDPRAKGSPKSVAPMTADVTEADAAVLAAAAEVVIEVVPEAEEVIRSLVLPVAPGEPALSMPLVVVVAH